MRRGIPTLLWMTFFLFLRSEAEYETFNWTEVQPYFNILCHGTKDCDVTTTNSTGLALNPCCKGCDCGINCTDELAKDEYSGITECMHFEDRSSPDVSRYKFIVAEPKGGCQQNASSFSAEQPSCGWSVLAAPWGNLYPVYSYDLGVNFKNRQCALCHGANNVTDWFAYGLFKSEDLYHIHSFKSFKWSDVVLKFLPPTKESIQNENICITIRNNCSLDTKESFYIPSTLNMTRKQVIKSCEEGYVSLYYLSKNEKFKNVFCALCNDFVEKIEDTVRCESGLGIRDYIDIDSNRPTITKFNRPFAFLIDHGQALVQADVKRVRDLDKKPVACLQNTEGSTMNEMTCREVLCPVLQTRLSNGTCGFPMDDMFFTKIYIFLNLTCNWTSNEEAINNMSKEELETVFKSQMPWPQDWQIISVLMRSGMSNANTTEFVAAVGTMLFEYLQIALLRDFIEEKLTKLWIIDFGQNVSCSQTFHIHGDFDQASLNNENAEFSKPRWALKQDSNTLMSNISYPSWKVLISHTVSFFLDPPSDDMEINQFYFCDLIELKADEFILVSDDLPVYLKREKIFLYPSQFHTYTGDDGDQVIVICLKDSDFIIFNETSRGSCFELNLTRLLILQKVMLVFLYNGQVV